MSFASVVFVILLAVVLCFHDIPEMKKQRLYRDITVYVIVLILGVVFTALEAGGAKLPNPADVVVAVCSPVVSMLKGVLE